MDFYLKVEACELLSTFESAYSMTWDTFEQIESFVQQSYDGDMEQFIFDVAHNCDYFSMAPVLRDFITSKLKNN